MTEQPRDDKGRFTNPDGSFMTVGQMLGSDLRDFIAQANQAKKQADQELFGALEQAYKQRAEDEELERAANSVRFEDTIASDWREGYE